MRQLVYISLLLITMLCFTSDQKKNCWTIKKSQNIMNMIVEYNSGTKLVLQKAICQSDPESEVNLKNWDEKQIWDEIQLCPS